MQELFKRKLKLVASVIGTALIVSGVLAGVAIVINDNNRLEFGVGTAPVNPCDPDVTVNIIVDRFNEDQYLTGFEYSFVDKPACVGYDIETRMVTDNDQVNNLFATTSLASDPTVIRVFSTSSVSNWQLGKGAFSGVEATVTQLSQSSFRVTFTTPVLLASNLGKILTAEIPHLPLGTFTGTARSIDLSRSWVAVSANASASQFYVADISSGSGYVWRSNSAFTSFATTSLVPIEGLPHTGSTNPWQWISQSGDGRYVIAVGYDRRAYFTNNFGSSWDSITVSSYQARSDGTNNVNSVVSTSSDGSVVCMLSNATTGGVFNIWKNFNFYSKSQSDYYFDWNVSGQPVYDCQVSRDGKYAYMVTRYKIFKFAIDSLTTRINSFPATPLYETTDSIFRLGTSKDGKYVVIGYKTQTGAYPRWRYSNDFGVTFSNSTGTLLNTSYEIGGIKVSENGENVAAAIYQYSAAGFILTSNDYGKTFSTSSVANNSVYNLAASDDGYRIISGTWYNGGASNKIFFLSSD